MSRQTSSDESQLNSHELDFLGPFGSAFTTHVTRVGYHLCRELAALGMDTRSGIVSCLAGISHNPGVSQNELATMTNKDKSIIVGVINKLEGSGWVVRNNDQNDRRKVNLYTTPEGEAALKENIVILEDVEVRLLADLSQDEIKNLKYLLDLAHHSCVRFERK